MAGITTKGALRRNLTKTENKIKLNQEIYYWNNFWNNFVSVIRKFTASGQWKAVQGDAGTNQDRKSRVKLRPQNVISASSLFWQLLYLVEYICLLVWNFFVTTFLSFCLTDRFDAKQAWDSRKTEIICKSWWKWCHMWMRHGHFNKVGPLSRFAMLRIATLSITI